MCVVSSFEDPGLHPVIFMRVHVFPYAQTARRNKLRLLQEREAAKARMGRLQTMLQQKLVHKYGSKR